MSGPVIFSPDQLNEALFHAVDIADRAMLRFMLLGETAKSIKETTQVTGDGIYLGIRGSDLAEYCLSTLRTLARQDDINLGIKDFTESPEGFTWIYRGVPISLAVIRKDYPFLNNPDFTWYRAEEYKIPNPFEKYWSMRGLIR